MRLLPIAIVALIALLFVAIGLATACSDDSPSPSPGVGSSPTVAATPFCTFIPGEGRVCVGTPQARDCRPTTEHVLFFDQLVLPKTLPAGLSFDEACITACPEGIPCNQPAEIKYANEDGSMRFQVSTAIADTPCVNGSPAPFGPETGCIRRIAGSGGEMIYAIDLQKRGRAHTVIAILGPDNKITEAELNAVALDIATQN